MAKRARQEGTSMIPGNLELPEECRAVSEVLSRVGDKWTVLVVIMLGNGPKRFNELRRSLGSISQRMLTLTLRGLERDGLVTRKVFPTVPARVRTDPTRTFLADAGQRAWCLGAAEPGRNSGRPPPLRSEGASARGLSVPRRPALRRELKSGKFESGRHRAAHQRPVAGARRRLPGMRRHHYLRALASG